MCADLLDSRSRRPSSFQKRLPSRVFPGASGNIRFGMQSLSSISEMSECFFFFVHANALLRLHLISIYKRYKNDRSVNAFYCAEDLKSIHVHTCLNSFPSKIYMRRSIKQSLH